MREGQKGGENRRPHGLVFHYSSLIYTATELLHLYMESTNESGWTFPAVQSFGLVCCAGAGIMEMFWLRES